MFHERKLLIATKHQKESVIAPLFFEEFRNNCFTSDVFDTDVLGTFSGEIDRKEDALTTLRNKCILASKALNCDLVVASEGSFGAHPTIFFAQANEELIMLKDFKNDIEIVAKEISMETNFNGKLISNEVDLLAFAKHINFPSHAIILKPSEKNFSKIYKGIQSKELLLKNYNELLTEFKSVYAETDMRAMYNPTRMKVIEQATKKLVEKIKKQCPKCTFPGFDIVKALSGLPCENCLLPTRSTLSYLYQCKKCHYQEESFHPRGIRFEDPTYCDNCNP
jgi:hypothetical protein